MENKTSEKDFTQINSQESGDSEHMKDAQVIENSQQNLDSDSSNKSEQNTAQLEKKTDKNQICEDDVVVVLENEHPEQINNQEQHKEQSKEPVENKNQNQNIQEKDNVQQVQDKQDSEQEKTQNNELSEQEKTQNNESISNNNNEIQNQQNQEKTQCFNCTLIGITDMEQTLLIQNLVPNKQFCCEKCVAAEEKKLKQMEDEIQFYVDKIEMLEIDIKETEFIQSEENKQNVHDLEKELTLQLKQQQELEEKQNQEIQKLKDEVLNLETEEEKYWEKINNHQKNFVKLEEKIQQADSYLKKLNQDIENIKQINVVNDVFLIYHDEQAGCINGLTIGKKKDQQYVDWDSTNSGLGQLAALFTYLKQKYAYKYQLLDYIQCNGNNTLIHSRIPLQTSQQDSGSGSKSKQKGQNLNLFGPFTKENTEEMFCQALVHFMGEFKLFCDFLSQNDTIVKKGIRIKIPYDINDQYLIQGNNQYSINPSRYKELKWDYWTQAMKYLLADFKYIVQINAEHDRLAEEEYIKSI